MQALDIGSTGGRKRMRMPEDFVTQTAAILARRGGGKTYTGNVLAEGLLESGHQVVVLDPLNAWWGLRSSADGRKAGYPVTIFGGPRGDLPLDKNMGRGIADLIAESPTFSCVLSMRHLRKNEQKLFSMEFAEQLFHRKGEDKLATAMHLFVDEADLLVPQFVRGQDARLVGAMEDLVRRGRQAGIGITMISQRSAAINKSVLTQAEVLIVGQITGPQDKKAVLAWVEDNDELQEQARFIKSLAELNRGQFWFWSPRWLKTLVRVDVRKRRTFDSSATPKAGKRRRVPRKISKIDLKEIRKSLEAAIKTAEQTDPKALRLKVIQLERELQKKGTAPAPAPVVQGMTKAEAEKLMRSAFTKRDEDWRTAIRKMLKEAQTCLYVPDAPSSIAKVPEVRRRGFQPAPKIPLRKTAAQPTSLQGNGVPKCEAAILHVLASRMHAVSSRLIALQSGYSIKSSGFKNALSSLRTKGWIVGGKSSINITSEGNEAFNGTGLGVKAAVLDPSYWSTKLPKCERAIFEALLDTRRAMSKQELVEATGYSLSSSGFKNALSKLRGLEIVEGRDELSLVAELFE